MSLVRALSSVAGAVLAAAAFAAPAVAADAPPPPGVHPLIIDGQPAQNAPWAARQFNAGKEACSATIIAPEWVLTAQHCVKDAGDDISFNIGSLDQTQGEKAQAKPGGVHIHDTADLALVNIDHPVQVPQYSPLGDKGVAQQGKTVQTYGWGATCTDKPEIECQSQFLKVANVEVTNPACQDYRGGPAVCAKRGDGIPAGGDSGGPMFATTQDGQQVQVGVASTSDRQNETAYGSVGDARDWIKSIAGV